MRIIITTLFLFSIPLLVQGQSASWNYDYRINASMGTNYKYFDKDTIAGTYNFIITGTAQTLAVKVNQNGKEEIYLVLEIDKHGGAYIMEVVSVSDKKNYGIRIGDDEAYIMESDLISKVRYVKK